MSPRRWSPLSRASWPGERASGGARGRPDAHLTDSQQVGSGRGGRARSMTRFAGLLPIRQSRYIFSAMIRAAMLNRLSRPLAVAFALACSAIGASAQEHPVKRVAKIVSVALEEYSKGIDD